MNPFHVPVLALAAWLTAPACPAQQQDPMREIQEVARRIDEQLQEIDRLLLESGKKNQSRARPKELLDQAHTSSKTAEDGIDTLIDLLNKMKGQSSSSSSQSQQQQDQQQDEQDKQQQNQGQKPRPQSQRNRRENQTPQYTERQRPQPGNQQQPQPGEQRPDGQKPDQQPKPDPQGNPQGGQQTPDGGQNTRAKNQPEPQTGPGNPGTGDGSWGELQPYMNFLKNRGSRPPDVPEKFRKYWEAYLKQQQAAGNGGGK